MTRKTETVDPEVGMGATEYLYSDKTAHTIVKVSPNGKTIWTQQDDFDQPIWPSGEATNLRPNPDAPLEVWTLRKNGGWFKKGCPSNPRSEVFLVLGYRRTYRDPMF